MTQRRKNFYLRMLATFTASIFCFNSVALPMSEVSLPSSAALALLIPKGLGTVDEYREAPGSSASPFIIHIQDLHASPHAQEKIRDILKFLHSKRKLVVALEGAKDELHPEYLDFFPDYPRVNQALVQDMVGESLLTGPGLYAWEKYAEKKASNKTIQFIGVETARLYRENLRAYRDFFKHEDKIHKDLESFRTTLETAQTKIFNPHLRKFIRETERRKDGKFQSAKATPDLAAYVRFLADASREHLAIDLRDKFEQIRFPNLTRILFLMEFESKLTARQRKILHSEIEFKKLLNEISTLEKGTEQKLVQNPKEAELLSILDDFKLFEKLFHLELTREEFHQVSERTSEINPSNLEQRLSVIASPAKQGEAISDTRLLRRPFRSPRNDHNYETALQFYRFAVRRDKALLRNTLQTVSSSYPSGEKPVVVLITGGFHTSGISELLKEKNISYAVVTPSLTKVNSDQSHYHKLMSGKMFAKKIPAASPHNDQLIWAQILSAKDQYTQLNPDEDQQKILKPSAKAVEYFREFYPQISEMKLQKLHSDSAHRSEMRERYENSERFLDLARQAKALKPEIETVVKNVKAGRVNTKQNEKITQALENLRDEINADHMRGRFQVNEEEFGNPQFILDAEKRLFAKTLRAFDRELPITKMIRLFQTLFRLDYDSIFQTKTVDRSASGPEGPQARGEARARTEDRSQKTEVRTDLTSDVGRLSAGFRRAEVRSVKESEMKEMVELLRAMKNQKWFIKTNAHDDERAFEFKDGELDPEVVHRWSRSGEFQERKKWIQDILRDRINHHFKLDELLKRLQRHLDFPADPHHHLNKKDQIDLLNLSAALAPLIVTERHGSLFALTMTVERFVKPGASEGVILAALKAITHLLVEKYKSKNFEGVVLAPQLEILKYPEKFSPRSVLTASEELITIMQYASKSHFLLEYYAEELGVHKDEDYERIDDILWGIRQKALKQLETQTDRRSETRAGKEPFDYKSPHATPKTLGAILEIFRRFSPESIEVSMAVKEKIHRWAQDFRRANPSEVNPEQVEAISLSLLHLIENTEEPNRSKAYQDILKSLKDSGIPLRIHLTRWWALDFANHLKLLKDKTYRFSEAATDQTRLLSFAEAIDPGLRALLEGMIQDNALWPNGLVNWLAEMSWWQKGLVLLIAIPLASVAFVISLLRKSPVEPQSKTMPAEDTINFKINQFLLPAGSFLLFQADPSLRYHYHPILYEASSTTRLKSIALGDKKGWVIYGNKKVASPDFREWAFHLKGNRTLVVDLDFIQKGVESIVLALNPKLFPKLDPSLKEKIVEVYQKKFSDFLQRKGVLEKFESKDVARLDRFFYNLYRKAYGPYVNPPGGTSQQQAISYLTDAWAELHFYHEAIHLITELANLRGGYDPSEEELLSHIAELVGAPRQYPGELFRALTELIAFIATPAVSELPPGQRPKMDLKGYEKMPGYAAEILDSIIEGEPQIAAQKGPVERIHALAQKLSHFDETRLEPSQIATKAGIFLKKRFGGRNPFEAVGEIAWHSPMSEAFDHQKDAPSYVITPQIPPSLRSEVRAKAPAYISDWTVSTFETKEPILAAAISQDGKTLAMAARNRILLTAGDFQKPFKEFTAHQNDITKLVSFERGNRHFFASASMIGSVSLWSSEGKLIHRLEPVSPQQYIPAEGLSVSKNGDWLAATDIDVMKIYDLTGINPTQAISITDPSRFHFVQFSPEGTDFATTYYDEIRIEDIKTGKVRTTFHLKIPPDQRKPIDISAFAFSKKGDVAAAATDGKIRIWRWKLRNGPQILDAGGESKRLVFAPSGRQLAAAVGNRVEIWKLHKNNWAYDETVETNLDAITEVLFSPDGKKFITAGISHGAGRARIWSKEKPARSEARLPARREREEQKERPLLYSRWKTLTMASFLTPLVLTLSAFIAALIYIPTRGHILFTQQRLGFQGKPFRIYKFRTMNNGEVTWYGKFLRKTGLDEIPQLWNILRGEMDFFGLRPPQASDFQSGSDQKEYLEKVLNTRLPGIFSLYAVKTGFGQAPNGKDVAILWNDYEIQHWSPGLKIKILSLVALRSLGAFLGLPVEKLIQKSLPPEMVQISSRSEMRVESIPPAWHKIFIELDHLNQHIWKKKDLDIIDLTEHLHEELIKIFGPRLVYNLQTWNNTISAQKSLIKSGSYTFEWTIIPRRMGKEIDTVGYAVTLSKPFDPREFETRFVTGNLNRTDSKVLLKLRVLPRSKIPLTFGKDHRVWLDKEKNEIIVRQEILFAPREDKIYEIYVWRSPIPSWQKKGYFLEKAAIEKEGHKTYAVWRLPMPEEPVRYGFVALYDVHNLQETTRLIQKSETSEFYQKDLHFLHGSIWKNPIHRDTVIDPNKLWENPPQPSIFQDLISSSAGKRISALMSFTIQNQFIPEGELFSRILLDELDKLSKQPYAFQIVINEMAQMSAEEAQERFRDPFHTLETLPAIKILMAMIEPSVLEKIKDWNRDVYENLKKDIGSLEKGEIRMLEAERLDAAPGAHEAKPRPIVFAKLQDPPVIVALHLGMIPNSDDGKAWFRIRDVAALGIENSESALYQAYDYLVGEPYKILHTGAKLHQEGLKLGIPIVPGKMDHGGMVQKGLHSQILRIQKTQVLSTPVKIRVAESLRKTQGILSRLLGEFKQMGIYFYIAKTDAPHERWMLPVVSDWAGQQEEVFKTLEPYAERKGVPWNKILSASSSVFKPATIERSLQVFKEALDLRTSWPELLDENDELLSFHMDKFSEKAKSIPVFERTGQWSEVEFKIENSTFSMPETQDILGGRSFALKVKAVQEITGPLALFLKVIPDPNDPYIIRPVGNLHKRLTYFVLKDEFLQDPHDPRFPYFDFGSTLHFRIEAPLSSQQAAQLVHLFERSLQSHQEVNELKKELQELHDYWEKEKQFFPESRSEARTGAKASTHDLSEVKITQIFRQLDSILRGIDDTLDEIRDGDYKDYDLPLNRYIKEYLVGDNKSGYLHSLIEIRDELKNYADWLLMHEASAHDLKRMGEVRQQALQGIFEEITKLRAEILGEHRQRILSRELRIMANFELDKMERALNELKKVITPVTSEQYREKLQAELSPDRKTIRFRLTHAVWEQGEVLLPLGQGVRLKFSRNWRGKTLVIRAGKAHSEPSLDVLRVYEDQTSSQKFLASYVKTEEHYVRTDLPVAADSNYTFTHPLFPKEVFYVSTKRGFKREERANTFRIYTNEQDQIAKITDGSGVSVPFHPIFKSFRGEKIGTLIPRSGALAMRWSSLRGVIRGLPIGLAKSTRGPQYSAAYIRVTHPLQDKEKNYYLAGENFGNTTGSIWFENRKPIAARIKNKVFRLILKRNEKGRLLDVAREGFYGQIGQFTGSIISFKADAHGRASLGAPLTGVQVADAMGEEIWMSAAIEKGVILRTDEWAKAPPVDVYDWKKDDRGQKTASLKRTPITLKPGTPLRPVKRHYFNVLRDFHFNPLDSYKTRISKSAYESHSGIITGIKIARHNEDGRVVLPNHDYTLPGYYIGFPLDIYHFKNENLILFVIREKSGGAVRDAYLYEEGGKQLKETFKQTAVIEGQLRERYGYALNLKPIWKAKETARKRFLRAEDAYRRGDYEKAREEFKRISRKARSYYYDAQIYLRKRIPRNIQLLESGDARKQRRLLREIERYQEGSKQSSRSEVRSEHDQMREELSHTLLSLPFNYAEQKTVRLEINEESKATLIMESEKETIRLPLYMQSLQPLFDFLRRKVVRSIEIAPALLAAWAAEPSTEKGIYELDLILKDATTLEDGGAFRLVPKTGPSWHLSAWQVDSKDLRKGVRIKVEERRSEVRAEKKMEGKKMEDGEKISGRGDAGLGRRQKLRKQQPIAQGQWESKWGPSSQSSFLEPLSSQQPNKVAIYRIQPAMNNDKRNFPSRATEPIINPARETVPAWIKNDSNVFRLPSVNSNMANSLTQSATPVNNNIHIINDEKLYTFVTQISTWELREDAKKGRLSEIGKRFTPMIDNLSGLTEIKHRFGTDGFLPNLSKYIQIPNAEAGEAIQAGVLLRLENSTDAPVLDQHLKVWQARMGVSAAAKENEVVIILPKAGFELGLVGVIDGISPAASKVGVVTPKAYHPLVQKVRNELRTGQEIIEGEKLQEILAQIAQMKKKPSQLTIWAAREDSFVNAAMIKRFLKDSNISVEVKTVTQNDLNRAHAASQGFAQRIQAFLAAVKSLSISA